MRQKLKSILLIDDEEVANYINETIIRRVDCCENVVSVQSGQAALDYLTTQIEGSYPQPDLIFLDINMPGMNGWQFLENYHRLKKSQQGKVIVVMLTSSVNPDDVEKARSIKEISEFKTKPMTEDMLNEIIKENFPDYFE
jgi:CheY-like chemotaxis protein